MSTSTKTQTRSQELTHALATVERELEAARGTLGLAVADDNISGAKAARVEVERLEKVASELRAAIPICRQREAEARRVAEEKARRERERAQNKARAARVAAARKVDKLMSQLGRAFAEYLSTETGGSGDDAARLARRSRHAASAALFHHAPELAHVIEPKRRPMRGHYQPLADAVGATVREFPEVEGDDQ
jgi:hypothetical protein